MNLKKISDSNLDIARQLNSLLAEEFQAWYQYFITKDFLVGKERPSVEKFFTEAANDELNDHAQKLLSRLNELGVTTFLDAPYTWADYAQSPFLTAPLDVLSQLDINIKAEQDAIQHYTRVIAEAETVKDYTTAEMLKAILADEEDHLSQLNDFKNDIESHHELQESL